MRTLIDNVVILSILAFAGVFIVFGLILLAKVLKADNDSRKPGDAIGIVLLVALGAAIVVFVASDFNGDRVLITTVGNWIIQILTEPLAR